MIRFVIPDFFHSINAQDCREEFPVLAGMLSKSTCVNKGYDSEPALLCDALVVPNDFMPSIAALEQFGNGELFDAKDNAFWCCVSPAIISPNRDHLDLVQHAGFDISDEEADSFCAEFNDYFKEDGLTFSHNKSGKWVLKSQDAFHVSNTSASDALGKNIADFIPQGEAGRGWRKVFNEIQMLLHHSATNMRRAQSGKAEINSLWFWGGGRLNEPFTQTEINVFSDDDFCRGLVKLGGNTVSDLPAELKESDLDGSAAAQNIMIVTALNRHQYKNWDRKYFLPALNALKKGRISSIIFHLDRKRAFTLKKSDLLKFWKTTKPLNEYL